MEPGFKLMQATFEYIERFIRHWDGVWFENFTVAPSVHDSNWCFCLLWSSGTTNDCLTAVTRPCRPSKPPAKTVHLWVMLPKVVWAIGYWWGISFSLIFLGKLGGPRKPIYGLVSDQAYNGSILTSIIYYIIPSPETGRFARFRSYIWEYKSIFWLLWYLSTCWNRFITRVPSLQSRQRFYLHTYSLYT